MRIKVLKNSFQPLVLFNYLIVILATILFFSNLAPYLFSKKLTSISLTHWGIFNALSAFFLLVSNKQSIGKNLSQPIFKWILFFLVLNSIWACIALGTFSNYAIHATTQYRDNVLGLIYLAAFSIIFYQESAFLLARKVAFGILVLSVLLNIYDFLTLDFTIFSSIAGRAAGLYRDPNTCGIVLSLGFILTVDLLRPSYKFPYAIWVMLGILLTQSRGGILVYSVILLFYWWQNEFSRKSILLFGVVFSILLVIISIQVYEMVKVDFQKMLQSFDTMFKRYEQLLGLKTSAIKTDMRARLLEYYFELWAQKPIFGHGIGTANFHTDKVVIYKENSHNLYLTMMVDFGIFGILAIFSFMGSLLVYLKQVLHSKEAFIFLFAFQLYTFTAHYLFDEYCLFFIYALFARMLLYKYKNQPNILK